MKRGSCRTMRESHLSTKHPRDGFLRLHDIIGPGGLIPVSKSTWYKGIKDGIFPRGVKLTKRTTGWPAQEIFDLVDRLRRSSTIEPETSGRGSFMRKMVPVGSIQVPPEADRGIGTQRIELLARVVDRFGLMGPIVTDADGNLLSGAHLFAAVKRLGWETVEVVVV